MVRRDNRENIMNTIAKFSLAAIFALGMNVNAQASDMDSAVAYSMGEFDRVGMSQPAPKTQSGKSQKKPATSVAQSGNNRQLNSQKTEFVRRMFWVALSMR
jgi:hypothetical protein